MTQIGKISAGIGAWQGRQRAEKTRADASGFISAAAPSTKSHEKNFERRKFSRRYLQSAASTPFLAQDLGQRQPALSGGDDVEKLRRASTLAYIGADMLPELLAETKKPRQFDGEL